jgi:hypothetical protein
MTELVHSRHLWAVSRQCLAVKFFDKLSCLEYQLAGLVTPTANPLAQYRLP